MSNYGGNNVAPILVDGYDCTGAPYTGLQDTVEAIVELNHGFGAAWQASAYVGLRKFSLSLKGFYDDTAGSIKDCFSGAKNGLLRVVCYGLEGNTVGKHFQGFAGAGENSYKRLPALGTLEKVEIGFASGGGNYDIGQIIHAFAVESAASGNTQASSVDRNTDTSLVNIPITSATAANPCVVLTSVPHGLVTGDTVVIAGNAFAGPAINGQQTVTVVDATHFSVAVNTTASTGGGAGGSLVQVDSDNGGAAYLQVQALTLGGYTDFAALQLHSSDNVTFTTLGTWTVVTSAPTAQLLVVAAGTKVKRYLAMSWSYDGAGSSPSVKFFTGFARR